VRGDSQFRFATKHRWWVKVKNARLDEELHRPPGGTAGEMVAGGEVQGVEPRRPAAHFAGETVAQQVGGSQGRLEKTQQPVQLLLLLGVGVLVYRLF